MLIKRGTSLLASMTLMTGVAPALAQDLDDWLRGDYATGDWGGARTRLEEAGITPEMAYSTDLLAVHNGNAGSGDGWDYAGRVDAGLDFDLEKLAGIPGLSFYASAAWSSGSDLSEHQVGNIFAVQQMFTGEKVRLGQLYLQQHLFDDQLTLKVGRLTTENDFLSSDIYANYVNGGINGTPSNVPDSNAGFTTAPFSQWGASAAYEPADNLRLALGVYNADDKANEDKRHGVDFALDGDAVFVIGEVGYSWNQPIDEENTGATEAAHQPELQPEAVSSVPGALPGTVKLGGFFESGNREDIKDGRKKEGSPGFYISAEQMVYREGDAGNQGLTPWLVLTYMPRESINELPLFVGGGLVYKGLIPTRDNDNAAIGLFYGQLSDDAQPGGSEKVLEFAYTAQLTPWFYVRPDLQLVFDPSGVSSADTAIVGGGEIGIVF
ncbi:MAG: carbohydrate porin [Rhodospirillales bacterium]|nr:carbohydrate porin [Rhodospirillales bacterium]